MRSLLLVTVVAVTAAGCATSGDVRDGTARLRARLAQTEKASSQCAPKARAYALAELDIAQRASERGEGVLAARSLADAGRFVDAATAPEMIANCEVATDPVKPESGGHADRASPNDTDGDGIADVQDACPTEPEDIDGYLDDDGCPDPDNDGDGISDAVDQCPIEPEDIDGVEDIDGCPERH